MRSTTTRAARARALVLGLLMLLLGSPAAADVIDDRRALVALRVLAYDKRLGERAADVVRIVIVYPKGDDSEAARWRASFAKTTKLKVDGRTVVIAEHELDGAAGLERAFRDLKPAAIVACDGVSRKLAIEDLARLTRANHVLSFTTREAEVVRGIAVGIVPGKERDEIVVNLKAAAAEGVKFDAGLLQLARTVGSP
jgi:hypothetical protein